MTAPTITLYSAKGGQGCSTVAAALAVRAASLTGTSIELIGDASIAAILGRRSDDGEVHIIGHGEHGGQVIDAGQAWRRPDFATFMRDEVDGPHYLVIRNCYLAVQAALSAPRADGIILVAEPGRPLTERDIEDCLGVPVVTIVPVTQQIARTIDAGLLESRLPCVLDRAVRPLVAPFVTHAYDEAGIGSVTYIGGES